MNKHEKKDEKTRRKNTREKVITARFIDHRAGLSNKISVGGGNSAFFLLPTLHKPIFFHHNHIFHPTTIPSPTQQKTLPRVLVSIGTLHTHKLCQRGSSTSQLLSAGSSAEPALAGLSFQFSIYLSISIQFWCSREISRVLLVVSLKTKGITFRSRKKERKKKITFWRSLNEMLWKWYCCN